MIIGADPTPDREILAMSTNLYGSYGLRRVYYSAFSPIPDASATLPPAHAPLVREHRLYQADWLLRFYGFTAPELQTDTAGNLDLAMDPKLSWALAHREHFPVDVNTAPREQLLRIPRHGGEVGRRHHQGPPPPAPADGRPGAAATVTGKDQPVHHSRRAHTGR